MKKKYLSLTSAVDTGLLILLLGLFVVQMPATIAASYLLGAAFLILKFAKYRINQGAVKIVLGIYLVLFLPALTLNHGLTPIFYLAVSPLLLLMAYEYSKKPLDILYESIRNTYVIFVVFIFGALATHWDDPEPLGAVLPWASTNGIPSYLIVLQIAYSLAHYLKLNRLPLLSSIATMVVAIFGLGRGSMVVGFLILASSIVINIFIAKSRKDVIFFQRGLAIFAIPVIFLILDNFEEIDAAINLWIEGSKFAGGVLDEHRGKIVSDYLGKIDAINLMMGASYENTSINDAYGGNPHNSFIRVHSFFGLFGLICVFLPMVFLCLSNRKLSQKFVFFIMISLALTRAVSEPIFFPSVLDFFYFIYFAMFFRFSKYAVKGNEKGSQNVATNPF